MTYNKYTYEATSTNGLLYCAEIDRFAALDNDGEICACGSKDDCIEEMAINVQINMKNILIGCECSGVVRDAFRKLGFNAYSCDLKPCETAEHSCFDSPYHLKMDVMKAIDLRQWDMIGLHPDCTALAVSGNRWYGLDMPMHEKRLESLKWTVELWKHATSVCDHVYLENPVGVITHELGRPSYIQPWMFGHGETKKTGLWLHGLNPLQPTDIVEGREQRIWKMPPSANRKTERSRTFKGIGDAMADQWGRQI